MKSYQRAVDSNFFNYHVFVLILILWNSFSFSQSISSYKQTLIDTEEKLISMKQDPLGLVPSLIEHLSDEPDNTYFKHDKMIKRDADGSTRRVNIPIGHDHIHLNHFTNIMVIDGLEYNLYSILNTHEVFYPGLFDEILEKDVSSIQKNHHYKMAIEVTVKKAVKKKRRSLGINDSDVITNEATLELIQNVEDRTRQIAIAKVEEILSEAKGSSVKWAPFTLAQKVETRICALLKQEHSRKNGRLVYRTLCKKGHELNDFLKREIKSYLNKRPVIKARAIQFRTNLPDYLVELNEDIEFLNGRCAGIKKGYIELKNMDMTEFTKAAVEAGYPIPYEYVATGSGSNYSSSTTMADQKKEGLAKIRNQKIESYFSVQSEEIEGLLKLIKNHKLIYFYFSQKFADAMGTFSHTDCFENGKGLNPIEVHDVKAAAKEILYDKLHHQLLKFLGLYEDLKGEQGKYTPNMALINSAIKEMVRLSPLSVSTVINKMHIADAAVYMKHLSYLIISMTRGKNTRDWWMGATKKIYSIGWLVGMALQLTMIPPLQAIGQAINYVSYGVYGINKILNAVDYAFTAKGLRYTQMAGTAGTMDIDSGLELQDYYLRESGVTKKELTKMLWELPLILVGEGVVNIARVKKAFRPLLYNADDLTTVDAFRKLEDLTLKYGNAHRVNKLKRPVLKQLAVILGEGASPHIVNNNLRVWMNCDEITWIMMVQKLKKMKRMDLIKLKTRRIQTVEPFKSLFRSDTLTMALHQSVLKYTSPGNMLFRAIPSLIGKNTKNYIIKNFGQAKWDSMVKGYDTFKDVINNLYSWAFVKLHFFEAAYNLMKKYDKFGRFSGYFALKYRDYLNEGLKRGYISLEKVKRIVNDKQIHEELQKFYMKYYIDKTGKLHSVVGVGAVKAEERAMFIRNFVSRYGRRAKELGVNGRQAKEISQYIKQRLHRANLGADELNVLVQKMYQYEIYLKNIDDARLLMDYIRDVSRYPSWQKIGALKYIDRLFRPDIRAAFQRGEDISKMLPSAKYFQINPVRDFYSRRSEYFQHKDWLTKRMTDDFKFRRSRNLPSQNEIKKIAGERARTVQEMKLGCSARTGSIFRSYAKSSYKGFSMKSGLWITAFGYGVQNYMKDKNAEFYFRFIYDMLMTAFGKYLKNAVMMNTNNTMWGKARSTNMIMALRDVPEAWLNVKSIEWVRKYIDQTIENPIPEDILNDEDFKYGIYAIHDAFVNNYLESDEKVQSIIAKLSQAENVNEVMYALYADESKGASVSAADQSIFEEIDQYNNGSGNVQQDVFMLLEDLEYKSRMELKEFGINSGSAEVDRYIAHRGYGIPMAFFSYGLSQSIYYNLCWGIRNPGFAYASSMIGYYSIASIRSNFYYWWINETNITQSKSTKEEE
ncbi:hypothetical protein N9N67_07720 [Bacteriovoracaceae bacterium]|nr:hypothetical protein [Bacteriovoracaceae bacterium]